MSGMFAGASFNKPIDNWNVSNVLDMSGMFRTLPYDEHDTDCECRFNQDLWSWDVESVLDFDNMFAGNSCFRRDITVWGVLERVSHTNMFGEDSHARSKVSRTKGN